MNNYSPQENECAKLTDSAKNANTHCVLNIFNPDNGTVGTVAGDRLFDPPKEQILVYVTTNVCKQHWSEMLSTSTTGERPWDMGYKYKLGLHESETRR